MSSRLWMFGMVFWSGTVAFAATHYVDCNLASYAGHDGTSWAQAYKTIQEGVNACSAGDTVLVAAGRYAEGGGQWNGCLNRVLVEKRDITVRSVAGKGETFIVGAHDPDPVDEYGNGPNAVRCVRLDADNAVIEGFVRRQGRSRKQFAFSQLRPDAQPGHRRRFALLQLHGRELHDRPQRDELRRFRGFVVQELHCHSQRRHRRRT